MPKGADPPNLGCIPAEIRGLRRFVVWRLERRAGAPKPTKVPYDPKSGRKASTTDPATWGTLQQALDAYRRGAYSGIGFVFGPPYCGVDLDECRNEETGEIEPHAQEIVRQFDSYTEISPSRTGLHIFIKAALPGAGLNRHVKGRKFEMYDKGRFFTCTGDQLLGTPLEVKERQYQAESLYAWIEANCDGKKEKEEKKSERPRFDADQTAPVLTDDEVMDLAMNAANGRKFERLWDGDIREYADDDSRADAAFVSMLCFWTQDDSQVERLWKQSGLYREKLDRADYVSRTIAYARSRQSESYSNDYKANGNGLGKQTGTPNALGRELTSREQIICRVFAERNISDETFRSYIATRGIANGRKTFRLSGALLARHIKVDPALDSYGNAKVNGNRRLNRMMKELKGAFRCPIFTRIEKAQYSPDPKKKSLPAKYRLDETLFDEAEAIAAEHPAMQPGAGYNPGKAREHAALVIADKYSNKEKPASVKKEGPSKFEQLKRAEDRLEATLKKIRELMEDMREPTIQFQNKAMAYKAKVNEILLKPRRKAEREKQAKNGQKSTDFSPPNSSEQEGYAPYVVTDLLLRENGNGSGVTNNHVITIGNTSSAPEQMRTGPAIWRNADHDQPVTVRADAGRGPDGRRYAYISGSATAIPADELVYEDTS